MAYMSTGPAKILIYLKAFLPSVLWAGIIFLFSAQEVLPGFSVSIFDFLLKKLAHMFVYAVLYLLILRGFKVIKQTKHQKKFWWLAILICFIYAITDELHQATVPGRHATLRDIGYDMLGVSIVVLKKFQYI
ncbi:MAG: hypothetical protein GF390_02420 [Candidatus Pacebacteria bacterium]|nr:hypothetical protein [Candidatus Paceibacterota bacterium]